MSRILLIDSNQVFRLGLWSLFRTAQLVPNISEADTFALGRAVLRQQRDIALALLDIEVPDCGGLVGLSQLRDEFPDVPVILLSNNAPPEDVSRAVALGAAGFIQRSSSCEAILQTVKTVLASKVGPAPIRSRTDATDPIASLSPALVRVMMGVKRGLRNKEIAFELGLTENTIKVYLNTLYRKLGVSSRTQVVILMQEMLAETEMVNMTEAMASNVA